jgi:regulator of cell morphogenesis and NO signaling
MSDTSLAAPPSGFADRTLANIAVSLPGATAVFRRSKLDFCCGGQISLAAAASGKGLALADLEAELTALAAQGGAAPSAETTEALIDLIETRYHAVHRRELPELIRLARRVEAVHKDKPAVPHGLADLLERIAHELESHMLKEERVLFPIMRRHSNAALAQPIAGMMADHDDHGSLLRELEALTNDFEPPDGACTTWRALYAGGSKFAEDLVQHIHIENNVLFPRFNA